MNWFPKLTRAREIFNNSPFTRNWVVVLARRVSREMIRDDATHLAAGVAYYAIFSLFPILLGFLAIAGTVLNSEEVKREFLLIFNSNLPGSEQLIAAIVPIVEDNVETLVASRGPLGLISAIGVVWTATGFLAAIGRAVDRAWDIPYNRPFFVAKAMQLLMVVALGIPFLLSFLAARAVSAISTLAERELIFAGWLVGPIGRFTLLGIDWGLILLVFLLAYRFLPNTKTYWRFTWPGAVVATVLYLLGRDLFILYLKRFASYDTIYGPVSSVMVFLFWIYISSLILVLGAEISSEYQRMRQSALSDTGGR